jgi:Alkyl sulfatase dimerisation
MTARTAGAASLEAAWHTHGYHGPVSHDLKAVDQRYLGWHDGNPSYLWDHPAVQAARRYVAAMGGTDAALDVARALPPACSLVSTLWPVCTHTCSARSRGAASTARRSWLSRPPGLWP